MVVFDLFLIKKRFKWYVICLTLVIQHLTTLFKFKSTAIEFQLESLKYLKQWLTCNFKVPQGCGPNSNRPPLLVFAVMVNPDILKANGKNAANPTVSIIITIKKTFLTNSIGAWN